MKRSHLSLMVATVVASISFALAPTATHAANFTTTHVRMETPDGTLLNTTVWVSDAGCTVTDNTNTEHVLTGDNALCALDAAADQNNLSYSLSYFNTRETGAGFFLHGVGDYFPKGDGNDRYWLYYVNYSVAAVGIDKYNLQNDDELLLTYGESTLKWTELPLRLNVKASQMTVGKEMTATVDWYSYDWMTGTGTYLPAAGATVQFGDVVVTTDERGIAKFTPAEEGELKVQATAPGFTRTIEKTVKVYRRFAAAQFNTQAERSEQAEDGLTYLKSQITLSNLVNNSSALTEWSAMAFAATGEKNEQIAAALNKYTPEANASSTDIARYILAVEAIGGDSRNVNGVNYIHRLESSLNSDQFGSTQYCNDDIFAALALISADRMTVNTKAKKALVKTLECVNEDGGIGYDINGASDVDTTASWIMMTSKMVDKPDFNAFIGERYEKAKKYIRRAQNPDGGWGYIKGEESNTSSTSWVMMGLSATGHEAKAMTQNKHNGFSFLEDMQKKDGSFKYDKKGTESIETLNTAYAVTALELKTLPANKKIEMKTAGAIKKAKAAEKKKAAEAKKKKEAAKKKSSSKKTVKKKASTATTKTTTATK